MLRVGNAPCSWGSLEFEEAKGESIGFAQMLDELVETGYTGTELGDWGFMPTDPAALGAELARRRVAMLGAFVPVALKDRSAHAAGVENAVRTARLLAAVATEPAPFLVLADNNGTVPSRTLNAGRITPELSLTAAAWAVFAEGANAVARAVAKETGLRTVFHHHCAGYVAGVISLKIQARYHPFRSWGECERCNYSRRSLSLHPSLRERKKFIVDMYLSKWYVVIYRYVHHNLPSIQCRIYL